MPHKLFDCIEGGMSSKPVRKDKAVGEVTLVGAGPGDPDLLTIKALKALQCAQVVLFDALVSTEIMQLVNQTARCISVGKRGGQDSCRQSDINSLMQQLALAGYRVVRLKCGDPSVFGRAGEELAELRVAGIKTAIIPGVTAATAMAAQLQITLTHRAHAQSVRFVTGHAHSGKLPENLDWLSMAREDCTTIYYMGGRTAHLIAAHLLHAGARASTPAVVCASVSRPDEAHWFGRLDQLGQGMDELGYSAPVLIGVGEVFSSAQSMPSLIGPIRAGQDRPGDHLPQYQTG